MSSTLTTNHKLSIFASPTTSNVFGLPVTMPKESLKKCTIAVTGSFGPDKDIHKVKQWIEGSGGKYIAKVEEGVTHLVCSQESFKKKSPIGKRIL